MATYSDEGQSSLTANDQSNVNQCKDIEDSLLKFLKQGNIPKLEQVCLALSKSDIFSINDFMEINENDIDDICKQFNLSIMIKRKLINGRKFLVNNNKIQTGNEGIFVKITENETKMQNQMKALSIDIESFVEKTEKMIQDCENEEKSNMLKIDNKINEIINQLNEYKLMKMNEIKHEYFTLNTMLNNQLKNGLILKEKNENSLKQYKIMLNQSLVNNSNDNMNATKAIKDSNERETFLENNGSEISNEFNKLKTSMIEHGTNENEYFYHFEIECDSASINEFIKMEHFQLYCIGNNDGNHGNDSGIGTMGNQDAFMRLDNDEIVGKTFEHCQLTNENFGFNPWFHIISTKLILRSQYSQYKWQIKTNDKFEGRFGIFNETNETCKNTIGQKNGKKLAYSSKNAILVGGSQGGFGGYGGCKFGTHFNDMSSFIGANGDVISIIIDFLNNKVVFISKSSGKRVEIQIDKQMKQFRLLVEFANLKSSVELL